MIRRVFIDRGRLITTVMVGSDLGYNVEPARTWVEQPLFVVPGGAPARLDYKGEASIATDDQGRTFLLIGDLLRTSNLSEYLVGDVPAESRQNVERFAAGFRDGMLGRRWPAEVDDLYRGGRAEAKDRPKSERDAARIHAKIWREL